MRILVHDYAGYAFVVPLSRWLSRRGHTVLHVYCASILAAQGDMTRRPDDPDSFDIKGIKLSRPIRKYSFLRRWMLEREYGRRLTGEMDQFRPDVVISGDTPLEPQAALMRWCKRRDVGFVFWVQDVYGLAIHQLLRSKLPLLGEFIGRHYMRLERTMLRQSDQVVIVSEDFRPLTARWGVDHAKVHVIENWAVLEDLPVRPPHNRWATQHRLEDKFCFVYSGTLGMKHDPELLLRLAEHFRGEPRARVVVVSEGMGADWLREQVTSSRLDNLILLPYQPPTELADVLGSADVLMAILRAEAGVFSVPSKVLTYLCAARPLLLAVPPENLAARIVAGHEAGLAVGPDDAGGFVRAAATLFADDALRQNLAKNARAYAETHFDVDRIGVRFLEVFQAALKV